MPASSRRSRRSDPAPVLPEALRRRLAPIHCLTKLGEGTGYQSWRVDFGDGQAVWRVPGHDRPGSDRGRERRVLAALPGACRAPRLLWTSDHGQLQSYTAGRAADQSIPDARQRHALIQAVRATWAADTHERPYHYAALVRDYQRRAASARADVLADSLLEALDHWPTATPCLTHHDLHGGNVLLCDHYPDVCLLDWEYAAPGNPWLDAVALDKWLHLNGDEMALLAPELNRFELPGGDSRDRYRQWLNQLEALWWLACDGDSGTDNAV